MEIEVTVKDITPKDVEYLVRLFENLVIECQHGGHVLTVRVL